MNKAKTFIAALAMLTLVVGVAGAQTAKPKPGTTGAAKPAAVAQAKPAAKVAVKKAVAKTMVAKSTGTSHPSAKKHPTAKRTHAHRHVAKTPRPTASKAQASLTKTTKTAKVIAHAKAPSTGSVKKTTSTKKIGKNEQRR